MAAGNNSRADNLNRLNAAGVAIGGAGQTPKTSAQFTTTLAAGGVQNVPIAGQIFYVIDTTAQLTIRTSNGGRELYDVGTGKVCDPSETFDWIEVANNNAVPVTLTIFIGFGDYIDNRLNVVRYRPASLQPIIDDLTDSIAATSAASIAANSTVMFAGTPPAGYAQRRWIIISNLDPNSELFLQDSNGHNISAIEPKSSQILFTSGSITVANTTASAIGWCVGEGWWKTQAA